jgi:hypothetical protein
MVNTKYAIIILLIILNLNSIIIFSTVFHGTSEAMFEKFTGQSTQAGVSMCIDQWLNLSEIEDQIAYIGLTYSVDINITNEASYSLLNFSENTDLFDISSTDGVISILPTLADAGEYEINITVSNFACNYYDDSFIFNMTIREYNIAPILNLSSNFTNVLEDVLFYFNVSNNVTDADGDTLYFFDNTSLFNIDILTGVIAFIPTNEQIGNHSVKITVSDGSLIDDQDIIFEIINVNDAPILNTIGSQTAYINYTFKLNLSAYDIDSTNDNLTFSSNTSWFLNQSGPWISIANNEVNLTLNFNFTNFSQWNGTYNINITVNDTYGLQDSEVISFTITYLNHPPEITSYYPLTKTFGATIGNSLYFNITKTDPDGTIPSTTWLINDVSQNITLDNFTWLTGSYSAGTYNVTVRITDGELDDAESWIVSLNAPVIPPTLVEGTSVGSGGFGGDVIRTICEELWTCDDWSICSPLSIQTRECKDLYKCGTIYEKPNESQKCIYVEFPSCFDGVQNQNEVLIDCGGVCKACPTCDDGIQNHGEEKIDCGGPCLACKEIREPTKEFKLEFNSGLFKDVKRYWFVWFLLSILVLSLIRLSIAIKKRPILGTFKALIIPIKVMRIKRLYSNSKRLLANNKIPQAKIKYEKAKKLFNDLPKNIAKQMKF